MLDMMLLTSFMHMLSPPHVIVMSPAGTMLGTAQEASANPDLLNADRGGDEGENGAGDEGDDGGWGDDDGGDFGGDFGD
jgi:hypothetical protein